MALFAGWSPVQGEYAADVPLTVRLLAVVGRRGLRLRFYEVTQFTYFILPLFFLVY